MGYLHIENLYKDQRILAFRRCYALEKLHGTSARIEWDKGLKFHSGGEPASRFASLFNTVDLTEKFNTKFGDQVEVIIYGEAYGGSQQGMSATYGKQLKFAVFDVTVGGLWLAVPQAVEVALSLGLEFVPYEEIEATIEAINAERDRDSVQAVRNGVEEPRKREGVVLRPLFEVTLNNGNRLIVKHKRDEFAERASKADVDPAKLKVLEGAQAIADEWVTAMRLEHVINTVISARENKDVAVEDTGTIVKVMIDDVLREAAGEVIDTPEVRKAVGKTASKLFIHKLKSVL